MILRITFVVAFRGAWVIDYGGQKVSANNTLGRSSNIND